MSDTLSPIAKVKFMQEIQVTENSPKFVNKSHVNESEICLTLSLTNGFVRQLGEVAEKFNLSYVSILNSQIDFFKLVDNSRLNTRFRTLVYKVASNVKLENTRGLCRRKGTI